MSIINRTMYPVQNSMNLISKMQDRFATLQTQLATGQKASNLAEMGSDRYFDLSIRSRMSRIEGYKGSIGMVNMRLEVFDQIIGRLDKVEATARGAMSPSNYGSSNINFGTVPSLARSNLDEVISLLNTDVDGRHLFAGGEVGKRPVETITAILDGAGGKAGFKQVAAERLAADQGAGMGRLTLTPPAANVVALAEDGSHPFGMKLSSLTSASAGLTLTPPSGGAPRSLSVEVTAQPLNGETVTFGLTMPDGTEEQIVLRAVDGPPQAGEFQIGADVNATALHLSNALSGALTKMSNTELVGASNFAAADNFFHGQNGTVQRVQGTPATATVLVDADPTTTVIWYKGEDAANARETVKARVDDSANVAYGAQANESGPLALIKSLAVVAIQSFSNSDTTSEGRFDAVATRNYSRLSETHNGESGSIEMLGVELGNVRANVDSIAKRQDGYKAQLEGLLEGIESVSKEEVAMEILALQTRLQASFQATSLVASLSLVNYLK